MGVGSGDWKWMVLRSGREPVFGANGNAGFVMTGGSPDGYTLTREHGRFARPSKSSPLPTCGKI